MKIDNLYNLDSFKKMQFRDAATSGVVLATSLISIDPRVFEKKYPENVLVNSGIAVSNIGGYGRVVESLRIGDQGSFANASDRGANKGKITVFGENDLIEVTERQAFSEWTDTEVKQADMGNVNLTSIIFSAINKKYMQDVDTIGFTGNNGNTGIANNSYFPTSVAAQPIKDMTPIQMYDTFADAINTQWDAVFNVPSYMVDRMILPIPILNLLRKTILNTANGSNISVLEMLTKNFPSVQMVASYQLTDRAVMFSTNEESMVLRIPIPLTVGEIIKKGSFRYEVECKYRIAGLDVLESDAGYILTGLTD